MRTDRSRLAPLAAPFGTGPLTDATFDRQDQTLTTPEAGAVPSRLARALPLAAVLLLAAELRFLFTTGIVDIDSLVYVHFARNVSEGFWRPAYEGLPATAIARVGLYGPVALLYALFGASDATSLAWTFACSMFGIACAYGIGRRLAGKSAGLVAAFLYAVLPTDVAAATAVMGDGPVAGLATGSVYLLLVAESNRGLKRWAACAAALVCLVIAVGNKPTSVLLPVVFLVAYSIWKGRTHRLVWIGAGTAAVVGLSGYVYYVRASLHESVRPNLGRTVDLMAASATDWWSHVVTGAPEYAWLAPLWIVATAMLLAFRRRETYLVLAWFWSMFLYLELGSRSPFTYAPISTASVGTGPERHFLLLAVPATIMSGAYLARGLTGAAVRVWVPCVAGVIGLVAWMGMRHATHLDWGATGEPFGSLPFATISSLAIAATIFGAIASPLVTVGVPTPAKAAGVSALLAIVGIGSLNLSYRATATYRAPWLISFPQVAGFLERDPSLPVFVQNDVFGERLDYMSHFHLGFASVLRDTVSRPRVFLAPQDPDAIHDAYILIDEYYLRTSHEALWGDGPAYFANPPERWAEIARFGDRDRYRMHVYRSYFGDSAQKELAAARVALRAARTPQTLQKVMSTATGAKEYCEAAAAWQVLREHDARTVEGFDPVPIVRQCSALRTDVVGPNLFQNGNFAAGADKWFAHPDTDMTVTFERSDANEPVWHAVYHSGPWQIIRQEVMLKPDTLYVYEGDVRSTTPVVSLYWESAGGHFLDDATYPAWTHLRYVFMTPHWSADASRVGFHPVLMKGPGDVWLKNLRLLEFHAPPLP